MIIIWGGIILDSIPVRFVWISRYDIITFKGTSPDLQGQIVVTVSLSMEFIFRIQGAIIYAISASNQSNNTIRIILFFQVGKY